jgi:hypothetical protein
MFPPSGRDYTTSYYVGTPPTSYNAWPICLRLWVFTASIRASNVFGVHAGCSAGSAGYGGLDLLDGCVGGIDFVVRQVGFA